MAKSKKYQSVIVQDGKVWLAKIERQVTSKKTLVSKQQGGFASEQEAADWASETLSEFMAKQNSSNLRHAKQRNKNIEIKQQRSSRRAIKTAKAKQEKAALQATLEPEAE